MRRLLATLLFASGIVMAQPVTVPLILEGNAPIVELITSVNIGKADNGEPDTTDLLCGMERMVPRFIVSMAAQWPAMPVKNLRAVVSAIRKVEGPGSPLLDEIRHASWCPDEVKSLILTIRGL